MDYQILSASSTAKTKDNWVGPGIYRLTSAVHDGKYLAVDDHNNLVVARFVHLITRLRANTKPMFIYLVVHKRTTIQSSSGRLLMPAK